MLTLSVQEHVRKSLRIKPTFISLCTSLSLLVSLNKNCLSPILVKEEESNILDCLRCKRRTIKTNHQMTQSRLKCVTTSAVYKKNFYCFSVCLLFVAPR